MAIQEDDIIRTDFVQEFDGTEDVINSFQFRIVEVTTPGDQAILDDIADWLDDVYTLIEDLLTDLTLFVTIRNFNITQDLSYVDTATTNYTGGADPGGATATGVAGLISFITGIPRVVPRKYFGVIANNQMDADGQWGSAYLTAMGLAGAELLSNYVGTNAVLEYGYLSTKTEQWEKPGIAQITSIPAYQRRRRQGVGS